MGSNGRNHETDLTRARILLIDDEEANLGMLSRLLTGAGYQQLLAVSDSTRVCQLYQEFEPDLICLDLHMPGLGGFEVLQQLNAIIPLGTYLPILMITGDTSSESAQQALALGARDFITKPFAPFDVLLRIRNLLEPRFMHLDLRDHSLLLEERVQNRTQALDLVRLEVLERLARAAEFRDDTTGKHTRRVGTIAGLLAEATGSVPAEVDLVRSAAPLHDVGKIGIPDQVLLKPGQLTPEEVGIMKRHTTIGAEILSGGESHLVRLAESIARSHHERWDGSGYPDRLAETAIPRVARIVAIADVFDALSHARPYRGAWSIAKSIDYIVSRASSHFDPELVQAFLTLPHPALV